MTLERAVEAFAGFCPAAIIIRKVFGFKPCAEAWSRTVAAAACR